jgi:hypothetical protein
MMLWGRGLAILNGMSHSIPHHQSHPICPILIMGRPILHEWEVLAQDGTSHLTWMRGSGTRWDIPSYMNGMLWCKMGHPISHKCDALAQDGTSHLTQMRCSGTRWDVPSHTNGMLCIRWDVPSYMNGMFCYMMGHPMLWACEVQIDNYTVQHPTLQIFKMHAFIATILRQWDNRVVRQ